MPHGARLRCLCLLAAFAGFAMCPLPSGLYLTAQTPSKEYIRLGSRVIAIESPVVTGVSPTTQHIFGGGGNTSASISADSTTYWSASVNVTWIGFNSLSSGTGPGTVQYGVGANTAGAAARTGTITISFSTGQTATLTVNEDALSSSPPTLALLNPPPNGVYPSSTQLTFTFQATSPNGLAYINHMEFEINNTINAGGDDCRADYYPSAGILYLTEYNGNAAGYTLGTSGTTSNNYHCVIILSSSSATTTDTSATLTLVVTLQPSAVGTQNVYISSTDNSNTQSASYGVSFGTWLAYNELTTNPPTVSMVSPVTTATSQVLHFDFSDGNGFRYIDGNQIVMLAYDAVPNNAPCQLTVSLAAPYWGFVYQIVNRGWNYLGSGSIGSGGMIGAGGPCALDLTNSKIHVNPNPTLPDPDPNASLVTDIYLDLSVTVATTTPPVNIYAILIDRAGRGSSTPMLVTQWP
jgi:hypothetical protein